MAAQWDPYHSDKVTTGKIVGMGENHADLQLVPNANAMSMATVQAEPATLLCPPHVQQVVWGFSSMHFFRIHFHDFLHLPLSTVEGQTVLAPFCDQ
jgi:hypothetical protein